MKKRFVLLMSVLLLFVLSSCGEDKATVILDNSDKSRFIDFYTEGEYVYIECELNIYSDSDTEVGISAVDEDNTKTGLLKTSELIGINKNDDTQKFKLKKGENTVNVLFRGEYAGIPEIIERDIPRFINIEKI